MRKLNVVAGYAALAVIVMMLASCAGSKSLVTYTPEINNDPGVTNSRDNLSLYPSAKLELICKTEDANYGVEKDYVVPVAKQKLVLDPQKPMGFESSNASGTVISTNPDTLETSPYGDITLTWKQAIATDRTGVKTPLNYYLLVIEEEDECQVNGGTYNPSVNGISLNVVMGTAGSSSTKDKSEKPAPAPTPASTISFE